MAKYVWYKVINNNLVVLKDDLGRIHYCSACPCIGGQYTMFVDLIELQTLLNGHPASNLPNRPGQYDTQITFNYFNREYATNYNLKPYTYTFPQFDYFDTNSKIFQQTVPVNVGREAHIDILKQNSKLVQQKIVSGLVEGDYSDVWHWNKFRDGSSNYLCTNLVIPDTPQFYQYVSSIVFNNMDYDLIVNSGLSIQREQFSIPSEASVGYEYYYNQNDQDGFKTYTNKMNDIKEYFATRVISADNTAYCYSTDTPEDVWDISNLAVLYNTIGGILNRPQAGDYVYIGTVNGGQMGLTKIGQKYYYHENDYNYILQYKEAITSCQVVPCAYQYYDYENSKYYTGLAFEYNNQTKYIYSKPSKLSIQSYSYSHLYPDIYQREIKSGYYTQYSYSKHPLQFEATSGWYFVEYYDSYDPSENRYVWLNDYTEANPPATWTKDGTTYYTESGTYYIEDKTYNSLVEVLTGEGYVANDDGCFYQLTYNSTTSGWQYTTEHNYPEDYTYTLSGGTQTEPPPYNIDERDNITKAAYAKWWKQQNEDYVHLLIDAYYDIRFGDLVNIYSPNYYQGSQSYYGNRVMFNAKYAHRNMSPFVKCEQIRYEWDDDRVTVSATTIAQFLTSPNLSNKTITSTFVKQFNGSYDDPNAIQFGLDDGYNNNISITTFRVNKPSLEDIQENWSSYYNDSMSSVLDNLCGVYCQILTGVYIKPNSESPKNIQLRNMQYQFRANGTFYQTLQFGQEYYFCPYFLQATDVLDVLSAQEGWDDYLTRLKAYSTEYRNFENNFKGNIIYDKFLNQTSGVDAFMGCYFVRPISGVTTLDGSQAEHLAPTALTSQVPT